MPQSNKKSATRISRRTVLRGAGVTMALPWLESLSAFADTAAPSAFPKRFGVIFMGNGVNEDHWGAEGSGADMKLSKTLAPLEPLKHKINVIHGLFHKAGYRSGHSPRANGKPALRRDHSEGRHHPLGHQRGSDDRQSHRPGHRRSPASFWLASSR